MDRDDRDYRRPRGRVGRRTLAVVMILFFALAAFERLVLSGGPPS